MPPCCRRFEFFISTNLYILQWPPELNVVFILFSTLFSLTNLSHQLPPSQSHLSPSLSFSNPHPCLHFSPSPRYLFRTFCFFLPLLLVVLARAGVWGEGGDNGRWLHSWGAQCDHHEPPYPSGLDVPLVLSAQVQLSSSGKDLSQGCTEGCARLWWVYTGWSALYLHTGNTLLYTYQFHNVKSVK